MAGPKKYLDVFQRVDKKVELSGRVVTACGCIVASVHFANKCHKPAGSGEGGEFAPADECGGGSGGGMTLDEAMGVGIGTTPKAKAPKTSTPSKSSGIPQPPFDAGDFNAKGKPNPGSNAWLHAHGIDHEAFNDRPYHRFSEGQTFDDLPGPIQELYRDEPAAKRQLNKIMRQEPGYIMVRNSVDGSPIVPQTRPDAPIVTNPGAHAFKQKVYQNAVKRASEMRELNTTTVIELQQGRVDRAHLALENAKVMNRDKFLQPGRDRVAVAKAAVVEAEKGGDPDVVADAKKKSVRAEKAFVALEKNADHEFGRSTDPVEERAAKEETYRAVATANAEKQIKNSEKKLAKYKGDPAAAVDNEIKNADAIVVSAKDAYDKTSVKYVFPPNPAALLKAIEKGDILGKAGRVNAHEAENLRRLKTGKGRVYLAMEGCIKEDALLTAVRVEGDKTSAVISVPSVTLWRHKELAEVAKKYLVGREVVLIPDADGVNNPRVRNEARAMQSFLESVGAKVVVAPPPIPLQSEGKHKGEPVPDPEHPGKVLQFTNVITGSPTGAVEQLKGVDDYLGLGKGTPAKGTLGNLAVQHRVVPPIDLKGVVAASSVKNSEKALAAISNIVGPGGSGVMGVRMLSAAMGNFYDHSTVAGRTIQYLQNARVDAPGNPVKFVTDKVTKEVTQTGGEPLLKVEYVFDPVELKRGKRAMHPDMTPERIDELVKMHVISRPSFGEDDTRPIEPGFEETPIMTVHPSYRAVDGLPTPLESYKGKK